ncbi:MAG: CoA transferase [Chloroflexi bacterium]|nr:CoA transferase [Chloroflexota bacterium]
MREGGPGPLAGLTVLDLANLVAGGLAASHLADFGARVIKVERPGTGDLLRQWGPYKNGVSLWWKVLARNKESITLNLTRKEGQEVLKRLVAHADVMVEGFRPGTMDRWGLSYDVLKQINPRLILATISGFGLTGPYKDRPGFGTVAESMSGFVNATGFPDGPPLLPPLPLADEVAGTFAAMAIMMALYERDGRGSGQGQVIDVSLYEPLLRLMIPHATMYDQLGMLSHRQGNRFSDAAPRGLYQAADGRWLSLSATTQGVWEPLAKAMGREDLLTHPHFKDNPARVKNVDEVDRVVGEWIGARPLDEAYRVLHEAGAVVFPVYNTDQILEDPHYQAREDIVEVPDPELGCIKMQCVVPRLVRTPGKVRWAGPTLGQHNEQVYSGLLDAKPGELAQWRQQGII